MQEMRIIQTSQEYITFKEQEKFSLFLFGLEKCSSLQSSKGEN